MTQPYPELTIEGDVDGDGVRETGLFEMISADVQPVNRTGLLYRSGEGGLASTLISEATGEQGQEVVVPGDDTLAFEIEFDAWADPDAQWGDDASVSKTQTSATGQPPETQLCVLLQYITEVGTGSSNPATFEWAEYSTSGLYSPVDVFVEQPQLRRSREDPSTFSATITVVAVHDITDITDQDIARTG